jgi:hypothetical protein
LGDAESGALLDPAVLRGHAERLLGTPAGASGLNHFVRRWLRIYDEFWFERDSVQSPPSAPALARSMLEETRRFIEAIVLEQNAPIPLLLTADFSFIDSSLASLYGLNLTPERDAQGFARVDLSATPRRGLLHQASWLVSKSFREPRAVWRATNMLELLCENVPPESPEVVTDLPMVDHLPTARARLAAFTARADCMECHAILNPLGFAFDHFDGLGAFRETDDGFPIDTTGRLRSFEGHNFEFASSTELVQQVGANPDFAKCYVQRWIETWAGLENSALAAADYASRWAAAKAANSGSRDAILAWIESEHFFTRAN